VISSLLIESRAAVVGDDDWYAKSDWWMPGCGDGHERKAMKWTVPRKAGEAMMMGMFASGMQQAIVLQQKAKTAADRLGAIRLKHCTTKTEAKETSAIVDAATKAGPMCKLVVLAQQKVAAAMAAGTIFLPSYIACIYIPEPTRPWCLGWLLLAEYTPSG
jgi:hypothetical protein